MRHQSEHRAVTLSQLCESNHLIGLFFGVLLPDSKHACDDIMPTLSSLLKIYYAFKQKSAVAADIRFEMILCGTNKSRETYNALSRMVPWVVTPLEFNVASMELLSLFTGRPPVCLACEQMPKFVLINSDCQLLALDGFAFLKENQLTRPHPLGPSEQVVRQGIEHIGCE